MKTAHESANVVIVGAGIVGTSIAFHLAEAGVRDVKVIEMGAVGSGSSSKASGGVRAMFSDEVNIQLGMRSLIAFKNFSRRPGGDIDLHQVGYLFLISDSDMAALFEESVRIQNRLGVRSRMISVDEAQKLTPLIRTDGLVAGAYSPTDGVCTPEAAVAGYARGARALGVEFQEYCEVRGIDIRESQIQSVLTSRGVIDTRAIICAAGAWSRSIGSMVGMDLPVSPLRRQVLVTRPMSLPRVSFPMTIDFASSLYFHREGPGLLVGMSDPEETAGFKPEVSDGWLPRLNAAMRVRIPVVLDVGVHTQWAGLYEMTPDHNALIGEASDVSRFFYATGFSGHGFLEAPAVGEVVRDLYLGRPPSVPIGQLSADRFARGERRPETHCV